MAELGAEQTKDEGEIAEKGWDEDEKALVPWTSVLWSLIWGHVVVRGGELRRTFGSAVTTAIKCVERQGVM